jgi:hypothetical protein
VFGPEQNAFGNEHGEFVQEQSEFAHKQGEFGHEQGEVRHEQDEFGAEQSELGPEQSELGPEQSELGPEQSELGREQGEFGNRQPVLHSKHGVRDDHSSLAGVKGARAGRGTTSRPSRSSPGGFMQLKHLDVLDTVRRMQGFLARQAAALGAIITAALHAQLDDAGTQLVAFQPEGQPGCLSYNLSNGQYLN